MAISVDVLRQRQGLPLGAKIELAKYKIVEWLYKQCGMVYVAYSGGKDSEVLLHLVRSVDPKIEAVFANTGLEFPEIVQHVKSHEGITVVRPKKSFKKVLEECGYPIISKQVARYVSDLRKDPARNAATQNLRLTGMNRKGVYCPSQILSQKWRFLVDAPFAISAKCCDVMKKAPMTIFARRSGKFPMTGEMASDSTMREKMYLQNGCNSFDAKYPKSMPLSVWTEQDVLQYIRKFDVKVAPVYGNLVYREDGSLVFTGEQRTGCIFCMFGIQHEKGENRFQRMHRTHPKLWKYCMEELGIQEVMDYLGYPTQ